MKKTGIALACAAFWLWLAAPGLAGVNVNVGIGIPVPLPVVVVPAPPAMVIVPGTPVYYAPGLDVDVFFYGGYWWTPHQGYWFRSNNYNGPWEGMAHPPAAMVHMPRDYRQMVVKEKPIPYGQWKKMHGHGGPDFYPEGGGPDSRHGGGHGKGHGKHKD